MEALWDVIPKKSKGLGPDFLSETAGVGVLAAGESWHWHRKNNNKKTRNRFRKIGRSSVRRQPTGRCSVALKPRRLHREQCHRAEGVSKHASKNSWGSCYKHLAWLLYSAKSRKILAWINWPFVVYFNESFRFMSRNIIKSDFELNWMEFDSEAKEEMTSFQLV